MRTTTAILLAATAALATASPQWGPDGQYGPDSNSNNDNGEWNGNDDGFGALSCNTDCWTNAITNLDCSSGDISCLCGNSTAMADLDTCIASSSCDSTDKEDTYQALAQVCANVGETVTASPEATFSATSGGSAYPTATWTSDLSDFTTVTQSDMSGSTTATQSDTSESTTVTPSDLTGLAAVTQSAGDGGPWSWAGGDVTATRGGGRGWNAGMGYGPFGGAAGDGWGPWASHSTGAWTAGPWTSWWNGNECPASSWSGTSLLPLLSFYLPSPLLFF